MQNWFDLLVYFIQNIEKALMLKTTNERGRYKKYDYKTHHNTFTNRTISQQHSDRQNSMVKSTNKIKKEASQNSIGPIQQPYYENYRIPFGNFHINQSNRSHLHQTNKKDSQKLKAKNEQLEKQVDQQRRQMQQLRNQLASIKNIVGQHTNRYIKQSQHLKQVNQSLQSKYENQAREMEQLQNQIRILRAIAEGSQTIQSYASQQIEESHVSRRAEYNKNYEDIAGKILKSTCEDCLNYRQEIQFVTVKYQTEINKLESQRRFMKEKISNFQQLEQEVQDKNKCIDYLRQEVEELQKNSKNLLNVIYTLEGAIGKDQPQQQRLKRRSNTLKSKTDQIFTSFNDFKY